MGEMKMKRRWPLLVTGVAILAVLLILMMLFAPTRWSRGEPVGADGDRRASPPVVAPTPDGSPEPVDPAAVEEPPSGALVIVHCSGVPDAVAFVSFAANEGALATERAGLPDGSARLPLPPEWFDGAGPIPVTVGVAGVGVVKTTREIEIARGETKEIDLVAETGLSISGRVVDANGSGVPGIRIVAKTMRRPGAKQPGMYDSDDLLFSADPLIEARAVSGKDGGFRLSGLEDRYYFLTTADLCWVIVPTHRPAMTPPLVDVVLLAERSYRLDLTVTDAETGEPLSRAGARLKDVGGMYFGFGVKDGRGAVVWETRRSEMREGLGFEFNMKVSAYGYESKYEKVRFGPGERVVSESVELAPRPMGELVLEITAADGGEVSGALTAYVSRAGEGHSLRLDREPGTNTYRARLPAGSWKVAVCPSGALGGPYLATWRDRMTVPEGGAATARVQLGAHGSLFVDRGRFPGLHLRLEVAGRPIMVGIGEIYHRLPAVRAGVWPYRAEAKVGENMQLVQKGTVEIHAGEETVLRIE